MKYVFWSIVALSGTYLVYKVAQGVSEAVTTVTASITNTSKRIQDSIGYASNVLTGTSNVATKSSYTETVIPDNKMKVVEQNLVRVRGL